MILSDEFWNIYHLAREKAEAHPTWNDCQMERLFALDQAGVSDELENKIFSTGFHEIVMIAHELYQIMNENRSCS